MLERQKRDYSEAAIGTYLFMFFFRKKHFFCAGGARLLLDYIKDILRIVCIWKKKRLFMGKLRSIISNFLQQGMSGVDSTPSGLVEV